MKKRVLRIINNSLCIMLLIALISCNMNLEEVSKSSAADGAVRSTVARCIEEELKTLEAYTEEDITELLNAKNMSGKEIVRKAVEEEHGEDYIDFCYAVNQTNIHKDSSYIMNCAEGLMNREDYEKLKTTIDEYEKGIKGWADTAVKAIEPGSEEAFHNDLKALVVRTSVMLVSAFVYAAVPSTVMWGKISAAAALSIGAGLAAGIIMDVYGYFSKGITPTLINLTDEEKKSEDYKNMSFQQWVEKLKEGPMASYAMATAATAFLTSTGVNKTAGAIVLGIFTIYNATAAITDMKSNYNKNV